ncbi:uncharacterized protein LOC135686544 [Rhopilema esculentum]|uniref:uncharacterized protein LOC135686544 n=1 Tax=Rhopilema esculentum TaxID=499914 RepID=UPI0031E1B2D6|eukprot:gene48-9654_t
MSTQNSCRVTTDIHTKYRIKRTSYREDDLEKLKFILEPYFQANEEKRLSEACIKRFLRAFLTTEETHEAIVRFLEWRDKFHVSSLCADDPEIAKEHAIGRCCVMDTKDRDGRPVVLVKVRLHDPSTRDMHSLTNYTIHMLEQLASHCNEDVIDNFCIIFDLKGFSLRNMDYTYVKRLIWILQNCYPERLGVCLIINSPWIFYGCWSVIKLWINEVTASKIIFVQNEDDLEDFVPLDSIPEKLI